MKQLKRLWNNLRASLWFVLSVILAFSVVFAVALIEADSSGIE